MTARLQPCAHLRHEALLFGQPVTLGQTVAKRQNIHAFRLCRNREAQQHQRCLAEARKGPICHQTPHDPDLFLHA